jgi:hypothetical protein
VTGTAGTRAAEGGPKRIWPVAVLFGLVSSVILATVVILATRSPTADTDPRPSATRSSTVDTDPRPRVAVVGDSITEQGESALEQVLSDDWRLDIDGRSGFTIAEQLPAARSLARDTPSQVIVNLGTNDVLNGRDLSGSAADLAEVVASFPSARCIHLVTVNEGIEVAGRSYADRSAQTNRAIVALAATDPRIDVIDWSAVVAAYEAGDQADGPILTDTVHPSPRGQLALAVRYADALASCSAGP